MDEGVAAVHAHNASLAVNEPTRRTPETGISGSTSMVPKLLMVPLTVNSVPARTSEPAAMMTPLISPPAMTVALIGGKRELRSRS
jgi:hypothetical protein